ncbi:predicted protein [Histoplasma mississippiense (nom. inval.)]|uniref:predicted protein n=1 Tax=Ajellomyces capsulatus (strain NAm1 / WU24) TaxID=2059318 RepID=UPI000157BA97|nr:predicted protein [Histoplasma mississippiense (nom. inval.)]EDN05560.1 predicted protein [Histoplasma mississippiense (nom. inval.)]
MVVNLVNRLPTVSTPNTPNATPNATPDATPNTDPNITPNITPNIGPNINPNTTPNINPPNATPNATPNQISIAQPVTSYSIYMDNYFTSVPLFKELRQQGYGACGTTRPNQVPAVLGELREHSNSIPWNTLHAIEKENVLCLAWQDNNMVLALTTIHSLDAVIERTRKCPGELSTNANIVRKVFEGQPQKKLKIPLIIDDYNHNMNGVDLANQYRAAYTSHRVTYRTWLPILYWLIDSAAVNAYRLQYIYMKQQGIPAKDLPSHISFHEKLYQQLFEFAPKIHDNLPIERSNPDLNHQRIPLSKQRVCAWCQYKRKIGQQEGFIYYTNTNKYSKIH